MPKSCHQRYTCCFFTYLCCLYSSIIHFLKRRKKKSREKWCQRSLENLTWEHNSFCIFWSPCHINTLFSMLLYSFKKKSKELDYYFCKGEWKHYFYSCHHRKKLKCCHSFDAYTYKASLILKNEWYMLNYMKLIRKHAFLNNKCCGRLESYIRVENT